MSFSAPLRPPWSQPLQCRVPSCCTRFHCGSCAAVRDVVPQQRLAMPSDGRRPIIVDDGRVADDSREIAECLEDRYAGRPSLLGGETGRGLARFVENWSETVFFFSSRRRHTICSRDWSSDVCSSDLPGAMTGGAAPQAAPQAAGAARATASHQAVASATAAGIADKDPRPAPALAARPAQPLGAIQLLSGNNAGKELELSKPLTTLGKPGVGVAVLTRRPQGYFITHVEGANRPAVNGQQIGAAPHALKDHDVIELAGVKMEFFLKA